MPRKQSKLCPAYTAGPSCCAAQLPPARPPAPRPARPASRPAAQLGLGTVLLLAIFSTPAVWNSLALDPVLANPSLILMLYCLVVLINLASGLAPLQLTAENVAGGLLGGSLGLACIYLTLLANGGSTANSVTKVAGCRGWGWAADRFLGLAGRCPWRAKRAASSVHWDVAAAQHAQRGCAEGRTAQLWRPCRPALQAAVNLVLSGACIFVLTLLRFKYQRWKQVGRHHSRVQQREYSGTQHTLSPCNRQLLCSCWCLLRVEESRRMSGEGRQDPREGEAQLMPTLRCAALLYHAVLRCPAVPRCAAGSSTSWPLSRWPSTRQPHTTSRSGMRCLLSTSPCTG